jgi:uncharacterized membrane-anchored protein YhcB (DUF1043 family)
MNTLQLPWVWTFAAFIAGLLLGAQVLWLWSRVRAQHEREQLKMQLTTVQT